MASRGNLEHPRALLKKGISLRLMGLSQSDKSYHPSVNRAASIRSSEWAAFLGINPYLSRAKYWRILKGQKRDSPPDFLPHLMHGHTEEPISANLYQKKYLEKDLVMQEFGARQYFLDPIYICSPDRLLINRANGTKVVGGLEIKNPWSKDVPTSSGPLWYKELAHRVLQCFLCMVIFEVPYWYLFYTKNKTRESSLFKVHFNPDFWDTFLYPRSKEFYNSTQPPPDRMPTKEKEANEKLIMENILVELIEYCPPICEED